MTETNQNKPRSLIEISRQNGNPVSKNWLAEILTEWGIDRRLNSPNQRDITRNQLLQWDEKILLNLTIRILNDEKRS